MTGVQTSRRDAAMERPVPEGQPMELREPWRAVPAEPMHLRAEPIHLRKEPARLRKEPARLQKERARLQGGPRRRQEQVQE